MNPATGETLLNCGTFPTTLYAVDSSFKQWTNMSSHLPHYAAYGGDDMIRALLVGADFGYEFSSSPPIVMVRIKGRLTSEVVA